MLPIGGRFVRGVNVKPHPVLEPERGGLGVSETRRPLRQHAVGQRGGPDLDPVVTDTLQRDVQDIDPEWRRVGNAFRPRRWWQGGALLRRGTSTRDVAVDAACDSDPRVGSAGEIGVAADSAAPDVLRSGLVIC